MWYVFNHLFPSIKYFAVWHKVWVESGIHKFGDQDEGKTHLGAVENVHEQYRARLFAIWNFKVQIPLASSLEIALVSGGYQLWHDQDKILQSVMVGSHMAWCTRIVEFCFDSLGDSSSVCQHCACEGPHECITTQIFDQPIFLSVQKLSGKKFLNTYGPKYLVSKEPVPTDTRTSCRNVPQPLLWSCWLTPLPRHHHMPRYCILNQNTLAIHE